MKKLKKVFKKILKKDLLIYKVLILINTRILLVF